MSRIINLKSYDLVFTTSFECPHGISGHLYELIDYYYISTQNNIKSAILLTDTTTKAVFEKAVKEKYNFTESEYNDMLANTYECAIPHIVMANNMCVVDGSWRFRSCTIYTENMFLLRCSEDDFSSLNNHKTIKNVHVMQDFDLYSERYTDLNITTIPYVKKILWSKYIKPKTVKTNTALFYLTTNCRALPPEEIGNIIAKGEFDNYLIVTNAPKIYASLTSDKVTVECAPVKDIFDRFDTYIYTATPLKADCSPRFIVECAVFGKEVIYEIDYLCAGVERRKADIARDLNSLLLTDSDFFIEYVKNTISQI